MFSGKPNKILLGLGVSAIAMAVSANEVDPRGPVLQAQDNNASVVTADFSHLISAKERYMVEFTEGARVQGTEASANGEGVALFDAKGVMNAEIATTFMKAMGATPLKAIPSHNIMVVTMDRKTYTTMSAHGSVAKVSADPMRYLMAQSTPYGIPMVQADQLSQNDTAARKVCVIDTGYNLGHPDLPDANNGATGVANNSAVGSWNSDGNGHGTHVAGTIAALDNIEGVIGVYPGVNVHTVKIFDNSGRWTFASDLIAGIQQCKDAGSNVVNMSLGGGAPSSAEQNAMNGFVNDGMMLVAAAGNDGNSSFSYPASYDAVISVGAVGSNESHASYSQYNSQVEIAGPGTSVASTYPTNSYRYLTGTSMATPHVAGAAALVWSFFPQCTNQEIRSVLNSTAKDKGSQGRDNFYGNGIVQAKDAFDSLSTNGCSGGPIDPVDPVDPIVDPVDGTLTGLSGSRRSWTRYTWDVPAGVQTMSVQISGGSGDADLYMRFGAQPSTTSYDCRPFLNGSDEICTFNNPAPGTWHIGLRGYTSFSGVTLNYRYQ